MSAPLRIRRSDQGLRGVSRVDEPIKPYLDRLLKMIPGEAVGLYLVGSGLIPADQVIALLVWTVVCFTGVIAIKVYGTEDLRRNIPPDWIHVSISAVAFVIWIYTLGGVFAVFGVHVPYIGSLLVLAWTFFVPIFYRGPTLS